MKLFAGLVLVVGCVNATLYGHSPAEEFKQTIHHISTSLCCMKIPPYYQSEYDDLVQELRNIEAEYRGLSKLSGQDYADAAYVLENRITCLELNLRDLINKINDKY